MALKLLDFGKPNPFAGIFGRPRNLGWPVQAFRVTIPTTGVGGDSLNAFERVILAVIEATDGHDVDALSSETCIPIDLVRTVLLRLRDRNLIDEDNMVKRPGGIESSRNEMYTTAVVFRELVGGKLLPYLHLLDDTTRLATKSMDDRAVRKVSPTPAKDAGAPPSAKDVLSVITQMKRRSEAYARTAKTPAISQVRVGADAERFFLDCPIVIQQNDADFRIADPFGLGYSQLLESALAKRLETDEGLQRWMTEWRSSLSQRNSSEDAQSDAKEPYENNQCRRRYPNLVHSLTPSRGQQHRSIEKLYAAIEWALFYSCDTRDARLAIRRLRQTSAADFSSLMAGAARRIGLDDPPHCYRPLAGGKLDDFQAGKAEMDTVLAIALLQADSDGTHPLNEIASSHPDFVIRLREIRSIRADHAHGQRGNGSSGESRFEPYVRETVNILVPEIRFSDSRSAASGADSQADHRLDARTSLLGQLGYKLVNDLGGSARDSLLDAEELWVAHQDGDDALPLISKFYACLQAVFRDKLIGSAVPALLETDYVPQAVMKAARAGLGTLPAALTSVKSFRVRETLQGNALTLGACVIAFLLVSSDDTLGALAESQPTFVEDLETILASRGHGNEAIPRSQVEAAAIRKSTIHSVRTLMEA